MNIGILQLQKALMPNFSYLGNKEGLYFFARIGRQAKMALGRLNSQAEQQLQSAQPKPVEEQNFQTVQETKIVSIDRFSMSPHQYWLTQGNGSEKPFTGEYWWTKDVGHYQCGVCNTKLFGFDHKFEPPTGMASFWHHYPNSIEIKQNSGQLSQDNSTLLNNSYKNAEAKQTVSCKGCNSHLGLLFADGPPPTFQRFSINSGAIKFVLQEWWEDPNIQRQNSKAPGNQERVKKNKITLQSIEEIIPIVDQTKAATQNV